MLVGHERSVPVGKRRLYRLQDGRLIGNRNDSLNHAEVLIVGIRQERCWYQTEELSDEYSVGLRLL